MRSYYLRVRYKASQNTWNSLKQKSFGIFSVISFVVGLFIFRYWEGWEAAMNKLYAWFAFGISSSLIYMILLHIWNLFRAPYQLEKAKETALEKVQKELDETRANLKREKQKKLASLAKDKRLAKRLQGLFAELPRTQKRVLDCCLLHEGFRVKEEKPLAEMDANEMVGEIYTREYSPYEATQRLEKGNWLKCEHSAELNYYETLKTLLYIINPQKEKAVQYLFDDMPAVEREELREPREDEFHYANHVPSASNKEHS